jgi:16S rRNA (guanine527-N7)-methyltransferase
MSIPASLVITHFPELTPHQRDQIIALKPLYEDWNAKINVISRKDMDAFYEHHVLHSLGIAKIISFENETRVLDVGTGGGFPGIPLAIIFPEVTFHLVDSIGKKITVVQGVIEALGLKNVKAEQIRAEQTKETYDFVVSRAVTRMKPFIPLVSKKIRQKSFNSLANGILALKGGDLSEELTETKRKFKVFNLSDFYPEPFFETKKVVHVRLT